MPKLHTGMCKFLFHLCYVHRHTQSHLVSATPSSTCKRSSQAAGTSNAHSTHKLIRDHHRRARHGKVQPHSLCPSESHRPDTTTLCREAISEVSVQVVHWPPLSQTQYLLSTGCGRVCVDPQCEREEQKRRMLELSDPETWRCKARKASLP